MTDVSKTPVEVTDILFDWSAWLTAEDIVTSVWVVTPAGLTINSETETITSATVWISSGSVGTAYVLTNTITTTGGRTAERSITVNVVATRAV